MSAPSQPVEAHPPHTYSRTEVDNLIAFLEDPDYSMESLDDLCRVLNVDPDNVPGKTKQLRVRVLVDYFRRYDRLGELFNFLHAPPDCPYPGVRAFKQEEARYFFGRRHEIDFLANNLEYRRSRPLPLAENERTLWIIGPSMSGKSSLISAGLLPKLADDRHTYGGFWTVHLIPRLGQDPLGELAKAEAGAYRALAATRSPACTLLIIDQFEDLFVRVDQAVRHQFAAALNEAQTRHGWVALFSMRSELLSRLRYSKLWSILPSACCTVEPLREDNLELAITEPARELFVIIEKPLVVQLRADAADEPGVLPLLQQAMTMLWTGMSGRHLRLDAYWRLGTSEQSGLAAAVETHANRTIEALTEAQQAVARCVLVDLVQLGEDGQPNTRRRRRSEDLRRAAKYAPDFDLVLATLTDRGLVVSTTAADERGAVFDLAHDILISRWSRLRDWLSEQDAELRTSRKSQSELQAAIDDWEEHGRDSNYVYVGARLIDAEQFNADYPHLAPLKTKEFLEAGRDEDRLRLRARYLGQAAGAAVGAACGYGVGYLLAFFASPDILNGQPLGDDSASQVLRQTLVLAPLLVFPLGLLVGGVIGLTLWQLRDHRGRRTVLAGVSGAIAGGFPIAMIVGAQQTPDTSSGAVILAGAVSALIAAGVGAGAGFSRKGRDHLLTPLLGGIGAAVLAVLLSLSPGMAEGKITSLGIVLLGAAVGLLTGVGLYATAVDRNVHTTS